MEKARIDAVGKDGLTLYIEFVRRGDRYGHTISVIDLQGHAEAVLESVEGSASDEWPASPPLQNLSIEELAPGRRAALLVGMAGRSHWSASIEPVPGQAALMFDVACRTGASRGSLGSQYRVLTTASSRVDVTSELECASLRQDEDRLAIAATGMPGPGTARWKYRVAIVRA